MAKFNVQYFKHIIREMVVRDITTNSIVMGDTYDMIELLYQATREDWESAKCLRPDFTARDFFAENFIIYSPISGKGCQCLFHEEDEGFGDTWGWVIDEVMLEEFLEEEGC